MIVEGIVNLFCAIANFIINLFPLSDMTFSVDFGEYFQYADQFINMSYLLAVVGAFIAYEVIIIVVRLALFVWNTIKP